MTPIPHSANKPLTCQHRAFLPGSTEHFNTREFCMSIKENSGALTPCPQCGAKFRDGETCADRFNTLLALDHSRQEPWGSRHGLAFAVYTLQHSFNIPRATLENCWLMMSRVYEHGDDTAAVVQGIRQSYRGRHDATYSKANRDLAEKWNGTELPVRTSPPNHFAITIADLADFSAGSYPSMLDAWCTATMNSWNTNDA